MPVLISGNPTNALVDTGASASFMSKDFINYLGITPTISDSQFYTASGTSFNILGTVDVPIQLTAISPSISKVVKFYIADSISHKCILGVDLLKEFNFVIDFKKSILACNEHKYSLTNQLQLKKFTLIWIN
eukprot:NODE_265_length_11346_cov_0.635814.p9 type:complete len:131 gc:universal NODE_265_length_11346_cov_0.635814:6033-5641(-)